MTGRFIVFEGMDGTGKSTLAENSIKWLKRQCIPCELYHFPRSTPPDGEPFDFYVNDMLAAVPGIKAKLAKGEWIISDRFWPSTLAYHVNYWPQRVDERQAKQKAVYDIWRALKIDKLFICAPRGYDLLLPTLDEEDRRRMIPERYSLLERNYWAVLKLWPNNGVASKIAPRYVAQYIERGGTPLEHDEMVTDWLRQRKVG